MIVNRNPKLPEVTALIIMAMLESHQGLTFEHIKEIYEFNVGKYPSDKTVYRIIGRINEAVDPGGEAVIKSYREKGTRKARYTYNPNSGSYFSSVMAGRGLTMRGGVA